MSVVVVTGAAGGIGRVQVADLAASGYTVHALDREPPTALPCGVVGRALDVTDAAAWTAFAAELAERYGSGASIVTIGSVAALTAYYPVAYTASKWALRGLTKVAAAELGSRGIRVNAVHPGFVETPMTAGASDRFRAASAEFSLLGRAGRPQDVVSVVSFLLGEGARHVTGAEIPVDGGSAGHGGAKPLNTAANGVAT